MLCNAVVKENPSIQSFFCFFFFFEKHGRIEGQEFRLFLIYTLPTKSKPTKTSLTLPFSPNDFKIP